ncbi:Aste57867_11861 [Aphanomyces stellatus]|uniref:Aste57867_11861 protein n=1 Tax=Aphanomyces stellatus TaxID=120398 RepID=A0A485KU49_9STRA|nr:hypothetical protein As57867_011816 [Aphanomyces stellatus]VFT88716.1 Aste57867_11861 [Aphanomyces stellatus]
MKELPHHHTEVDDADGEEANQKCSSDEGNSYDSEGKIASVHPWRQLEERKSAEDAAPVFHSGRLKRLKPATQATLSPLTLTPRAPSSRRVRGDSLDDSLHLPVEEKCTRRYSEQPLPSAAKSSDLSPASAAGSVQFVYEFSLWKKATRIVVPRDVIVAQQDKDDRSAHPHRDDEPAAAAPLVTTDRLSGSLSRLELNNQDEDDVLLQPVRKQRSSSMQEDMRHCELMQSNSPDFSKYHNRFFAEGQSRLKWKRGDMIGEGTFGKVYKGLNASTGELFAVKQIQVPQDKKHEPESKTLAKLGEEITLMKELRHQHIVRYQGTERDAQFFYIFMEYVPGGSIARMLAEYGVFDLDLIRKFTRQILLGVEYLHSKDIIHRDIKGANVLVNEQGVAKLADFGCSKQLSSVITTSMEESLRSIRGSVPWMAPEGASHCRRRRRGLTGNAVVKQIGHDFKADIWSVGATVIEMATAKHPWPANTNHVSVMFQLAIDPTSPPIPESLPDVVKSFLQRCFCIDPRERATATELLRHPFLQYA